MSKEGINKEWIITSTKEGHPKSLSEIAILTDEEYFTLDQCIGKDFSVSKPILQFEGSHYNDVLKTIILKSVEDIIILFHEIGHAVLETEKSDIITKKIPGKIEGKIRMGENINDLNLEEINELIRIRSERMASAYALRKIREIRKEHGIDLLHGKSFDEVKSQIDSGINSYFYQISNTKEYKEKIEKLLKRLEVKKVFKL